MKELQKRFDAADADGLLERGTELFREGNEPLAFEYYRAACKLGNVVAMGNLGYCYQHGRGVKADFRLAAYCFERASQQGDGGSTLKMGDFHYYGKGGLPADRTKAVAYYQRAYELLSSEETPNAALLAQVCYRIGTCKKDGTGTEKDPEAAYEFLQYAEELLYDEAESGNLSAERLLEKIRESMERCEELL